MYRFRYAGYVAGYARFDGQLMKLIHIPACHVDYAWRDGADKLGESCADECTPDQLKTRLAMGERDLVRLDDDGKTVGWGAFYVQQLPNMRVFFISNLWARGAHFERFFEELRGWAERLGCSRIRCAALPAQSRIFQTKCQFKPVYEILEVLL